MEKNKFGFLNIIVLVLSIYVLGSLLIDTIFKLPKETSILLEYIDLVICIFFLIDFCVQFYNAESKTKFMKWGWIDLLASIPMIGFIRFGRLLRLIRLLRIIKAFGSIKLFLKHLGKNKIESTFSSVSAIAILITIFSAIAILQVEVLPECNIKTAEDAIWWSYVSITTVGYGDKYPITTEGRIIAAFLMTAGVGLFGTFTAYIASWFVNEKENK